MDENKYSDDPKQPKQIKTDLSQKRRKKTFEDIKSL